LVSKLRASLLARSTQLRRLFNLGCVFNFYGHSGLSPSGVGTHPSAVYITFNVSSSATAFTKRQ
jgi:hypothetical protein